MEKPNKSKRNRIISFRSNKVSFEVIHYLEELSKFDNRNKFITDAINNQYKIEKDFKKYMQDYIKLNYYFVRHLLRQEGRRIKDLENNQKMELKLINDR